MFKWCQFQALYMIIVLKNTLPVEVETKQRSCNVKLILKVQWQQSHNV